jgi:hypothetical protein
MRLFSDGSPLDQWIGVEAGPEERQIQKAQKTVEKNDSDPEPTARERVKSAVAASSV